MKNGRATSGVTATLSFRLLVILSVSILVLFGLAATLMQRFQSAAIESTVKSSAWRSSEFIRQSLSTAMLRNERDRIHEMITLLASEPGVDVIRVYNKQGVITFSSHEREMGTAVDRQAEACYVCHAASAPLALVPTSERARIYTGNGHRVLGVINAIRNDRKCSDAACHAHAASVSVLGVLDVQMSLAAVDQAGAAARRRTLAVAVVLVLVTVVLIAGIVYRAVYLPTLALRRGTERLAAGDLSVTIDLDRDDELGQLAASFNQMAAGLRTADAELREWSRTLEERVRQKTGELEQMGRQLVHVEKTASLGRMAATVAHEINNPLSGILTNAKLTSRRLSHLMPAGPEQDRMLRPLELIQSEAVRCGNIVRDLLTYARQGSMEFRTAHLHALVDRTLELVAHHTELRHVRTARDLTLADDTLICDPDQIVQALVALCVNAVEAMGEGGTLTLGTAPDPADAARMRLTVSDTGIGIPPETQPHIFDPFFSTKDEAKGVGLGLAVVLGIVQRHDGAITVTSQQGRGTTFTITLPRQG